MKNKISKTSTKLPRISVVLPVYNAQKFLRASIDSILNQTYKDFEIIAVDDCSTDRSLEILKEYGERFPEKITVLQNSSNKGVSETAKKAIAVAKGEFIARMDADDIALPQRFEKQLKHLQDNKNTVAVGGQCLVIDDKNNLIGKKAFPTSFADVYKFIFRFVPVQQPTIMIARKRLPLDFNYYVNEMKTAEEVELFFKLFQYGKVENLSDVVLLYRIHDGNTSLKNIKQTFLFTLIARFKGVAKYHYKPSFTGVLTTVIQAGIVLLLPQGLTLLMYKAIRDDQQMVFMGEMEQYLYKFVSI